MNPVSITRGDSPLVLAFPHAGTYVPDAVMDRLNPVGRQLADTDWHVDRLYQGLMPGATMVRANFHRYVIDANRDPSGHSLYPGQNTTGLVPIIDFDAQPIWLREPDDSEIAARLESWHRPYHAALAAELARVRALHGHAILFDGHSIRSRVPYLFDGALPDFNLGTNDGRSCTAAVQQAGAVCAAADGYSHVVNGRFKGGWTTRHYGQPETGVQAIQLELSQAVYLATQAAPFTYDPDKADALRPVLARLLAALVQAAEQGTPQ